MIWLDWACSPSRGIFILPNEELGRLDWHHCGCIMGAKRADGLFPRTGRRAIGLQPLSHAVAGLAPVHARYDELENEACSPSLLGVCASFRVI